MSYFYECTQCKSASKFTTMQPNGAMIKCHICGNSFEAKSKQQNGSPEFYKLLEEMAKTHDSKSHDYASNSDPFGNYHFAGQLSQLFNNPHDAGFIGRIGEKLYRLANIENNNKIVLNESIEDTEKDIAVITALWMADRRSRRLERNKNIDKIKKQMNSGEWRSDIITD